MTLQTKHRDHRNRDRDSENDRKNDSVGDNDRNKETRKVIGLGWFEERWGKCFRKRRGR